MSERNKQGESSSDPDAWEVNAAWTKGKESEQREIPEEELALSSKQHINLHRERRAARLASVTPEMQQFLRQLSASILHFHQLHFSVSCQSQRLYHFNQEIDRIGIWQKVGSPGTNGAGNLAKSL